MLANLLESTAALLAVFTPLVVVPLTVITFYLRSIHERQLEGQEDFTRRVNAVESTVADLRGMLREFERDYTTKEEWLRECMQARRVHERLSAVTVRVEATVGALIRGGRTAVCADGKVAGPIVIHSSEEDRPMRSNKDGE